MRIVENNNLLDLFDTGIFDAILHQANCYNKMEAGIAKQIKQRYPEAFEVDINCSPYRILPLGAKRLGDYSLAYFPKKGLIVNAYGQLDWRRQKDGAPNTDIAALEEAITQFLQAWVKEYKIMIVGLPYGIGAGLGGGNWNDIYNMLQRVDRKFPTVELVLVSLGEVDNG